MAINVARYIPRSQFGSALAGAVYTALTGICLSKLSTEFYNNYGFALFIGLSFLCGFMPAFLYCYREERDLPRTICVSMLAFLLLGVGLLVIAIEGLICLIMALPFFPLVATPGAIVGFAVANRYRNSRNRHLPLSTMLVALPLLMGFEAKLGLKPPIHKVVTSVDIRASRETVWQYVVTFPPLPESEELIFKAGIAYPKSATISGRGPGAVRHCNFSTGPFVEPITKWQEPSLLKFDVTENPPPMREISIYQNLQTPHLEHFMNSRGGQFRLIALDAHTTRLEGTTWYSHRLWPAFYWKMFSDSIIHKIHLRVLNHVKLNAESA